MLPRVGAARTDVVARLPTGPTTTPIASSLVAARVSPTSVATILAAVSDILPPVAHVLPTVTDVFPAIAYSAIVLPVANVFPAIPHIFPAVPAVLESVAPLAVRVSSLILCEDGGRDEE